MFCAAHYLRCLTNPTLFLTEVDDDNTPIGMRQRSLEASTTPGEWNVVITLIHECVTSLHCGFIGCERWCVLGNLSIQWITQKFRTARLHPSFRIVSINCGKLVHGLCYRIMTASFTTVRKYHHFMWRTFWYWTRRRIEKMQAYAYTVNKFVLAWRTTSLFSWTLLARRRRIIKHWSRSGVDFPRIPRTSPSPRITCAEPRQRDDPDIVKYPCQSAT